MFKKLLKQMELELAVQETLREEFKFDADSTAYSDMQIAKLRNAMYILEGGE
tara:strand:+ start:576 stop:731 length:156 start_codon:yes stop_codon:yes gene_type:complete